MEKMYKTGGWKELIEEVEIIKKSEHSVWTKSGRNAISSQYTCFFNTLEEARSFVRKNLEDDRSRYLRRIAEIENKLEKLKCY